MSGFNFLYNLSVKTRIYASFGLILGLMLLISVIGWTTMNSASDRTQTYIGVSGHALGVSVLAGNFTDGRRAVVSYAQTGNEATYTKARELFASVNKDLGEIIAATSDPVLKDSLQKITSQITAYDANLVKVYELRQTRDTLLNGQLLTLGPKAKQNLDSVTKDTLAANDYEAASASGALVEQLLTARLSVARFMYTGDIKMLDQGRDELGELQKRIQGALPAFHNAQSRQLVQESGELAATYAEKLAQLADVSQTSFDLVNKIMPDQAQTISDLVTSTRNSQKTQLSTLADETLSRMATAMRTSLLIQLATLAGGLLMAVTIAASIIRPVDAMTATMSALAAGDKSVPIPATENKDEIGEMARAVQVFKESMIRAETLEAQARAEQEKEVARGRKRELLTADFDVMIRRVIAKVDNTVQSVHASSTSLHAAAEQTSRQSAAVAAAAEQTSQNMQTVASAAEQLGASTVEISRRVQDTTRITQEAVLGVQTADGIVDGLSTGAQRSARSSI